MQKRAKTKERNGKNKVGTSLLVVNMRGLVNTRTPVRETLGELSLLHRFNATIVPDNDVYRGMLKSAKEHVAWCVLDKTTAENLLSKRAEKSSGNRVGESVLKGSGFSSFGDLASALAEGKTTLNEAVGIRSFFRLNPPKGGFARSIRRQYGEGGILGPNNDLAELVATMM